MPKLYSFTTLNIDLLRTIDLYSMQPYSTKAILKTEHIRNPVLKVAWLAVCMDAADFLSHSSVLLRPFLLYISVP